MSKNLRGILWMIACCFAGTVMVGIVRYLSESNMHFYEIIFYRCLFGTILFSSWFAKSGFSALKTTQMSKHILRAVIGFIGMALLFYCITVMELALITSITFALPLITAVLAVFIYGEKLGIKRSLALIVGFIGVLIVVRPGTTEFDIHSILVLIATFFWAWVYIIIKNLSKTETPKLIAFYTTAWWTLMSLPLAIWFGEGGLPTGEQFMWLIALGIASNAVQLSMSHAISATDFYVIMPFEFTRLIFVILMGAIFFNEIPDSETIIGGAIIMASATYSAYRDVVKKRETTVI